MAVAGTGGSHRDDTRPYPHFSLHTRDALLWTPTRCAVPTLHEPATLGTAKAVIRTEIPEVRTANAKNIDNAV